MLQPALQHPLTALRSVSKSFKNSSSHVHSSILWGFNISQYLHVLSLLFFLGLEEKGKEIGLSEPRGARQEEPPPGICDLEGHSYDLSQGADARRDRENSPQPLAVLSPTVRQQGTLGDTAPETQDGPERSGEWIGDWANGKNQHI